MKIEGLTFSYGNNLIFEKVSFETNSKIAVLTGPSGCGKTTFLKIAAGWATPSTVSMDYNTKGTLLVIQEDAFLPWLSGIENIRFVLPEKVASIKNHALYEEVRSFIEKKAYEMSFGQRRCLEIFRAILAAPAILLLDEPFNFLDRSFRKAMVDSLLDVTHQQTQLIFTSHYNEDISDLSAEVFYLNGQFPYSNLIIKSK